MSRVTIGKSAETFQKVRRKFIRDAVHHFAKSHIPVRADDECTRLCWQDGDGRIGFLRVHRYCEPSARHPKMPLLFRVGAMGDLSSAAPALYDGLGGVRAADVQSVAARLELTSTPAEVCDFARWYAQWVVLRARPELPGVAPPHPLCEPDGADLRHLRYAWTVAAADAYRPYQSLVR